MSRKNNFNTNRQFNQHDESTRKLVKDIKDKLDKSPALNGDFDTLLNKVDKIEEGSGQLSKKVDKIYEAIYHHDNGIIAKMKESNHDNQNAHQKTSNDLSLLKEWKNEKEKLDEKINTKLDKIEVINDTVKDLVESRNTTWSFFKWFLAGIGGGIITIVSRYILYLITR